MQPVPPPSSSDEHLMSLVQRDDRGAFLALYQRWRDPIWRFLRRRLGQQELAEEAFQEVWVRLWRSRERYDPERPLRPWLYTIAANIGRDHRPRAALPPELERHIASPSAQVLARDTLSRLIDSLSGTERTIILLTAEGFTPAEIAAVIGARPGAVRTRLSRARGRLREDPAWS